MVGKQRISRFFGYKKKWIESRKAANWKLKREKEATGNRQCVGWIRSDQIITGYPLKAAIRTAENSELWKEIVANVDWRVIKLPFKKMDLRRRRKRKFKNDFVSNSLRPTSVKLSQDFLFYIHVIPNKIITLECYGWF